MIPMTQAIFSVRMDEDLKKDFSDLCDTFGISMAADINLFAKTVVRERRIPFEITAEPINETGLQSFMKIRELMKQRDELSLDEINAEISASRKA